jgi:hypothetical protein
MSGVMLVGKKNRKAKHTVTVSGLIISLRDPSKAFRKSDNVVKTKTRGEHDAKPYRNIN